MWEGKINQWWLINVSDGDQILPNVIFQTNKFTSPTITNKFFNNFDPDYLMGLISC